jgi:hypothetical protein
MTDIKRMLQNEILNAANSPANATEQKALAAIDLERVGRAVAFMPEEL